MDKTVLLVEDCEVQRKMIKSVLSMRYNVDEAGSAEEAISIYDPNKHSVIITDYEMDKLSGADFIKFVDGKTPSILMSSDNHEKEALQAGASCFFMKPTLAFMLINKIDELMGEELYLGDIE